MVEVQVRTAGGEYQVFIGRNLYESNLGDFLSGKGYGKLVVVSHSRIVDLHGGRLMAALQRIGDDAIRIEHFFFPEGEKYKTMQTLWKGYRFLLDEDVSRSDALLAFGGGVVGDMAGYLASSYLRGVDYLQVPTTLMAMVDSSIGGKVGIDLPGAKNAVGAFYQPQAVYCDLDVLESLPERELSSGLAEVAKYGFLYDPMLLHYVETRDALGGKEESEAIIARCAAIKSKVVEKDERDLSGERAILNYGHTFGHALESSTSYQLLRHGEAVAMGMIMASRTAELTGLAEGGLTDLHLKILRPLLSKVAIPDNLDLEKAVINMKTDKKKTRDLRFVLLEEPQKPHLVDSVAEEVVIQAMRETLERLKGV
jgi:3-dehydroquinate synthase